MNKKTYEGTEYPYAFISYSHKDSDLVMPFLQKINQMKIRLWYDDGIKHENWRERLNNEIIGSEVMIVFLSENYNSSTQCQREVNIADDHHVPFILFRLDNTVPSGALEYTFAGLQYKDLFSATPYNIEELTENPLIEKCILGNSKELTKALQSFPLLNFSAGEFPNQVYYSKRVMNEDLNNIDWGPERKLYKKGENPSFPVFNSEISDFFGDERYFTEIKEEGENGYSRELLIEPDKTYDVRVLYHNNADVKSNESGKGICTGLKVAIKFPIVVLPGRVTYIQSGLQALRDTLIDDPLEIRLPSKKSLIQVWSSVKLYADNVPVFMNFIPASGIIENKGKLNCTVLPQSLFTNDGAYLGYNVIRGLLPGGEDYAGFVHFKFNTYSPDITKDICVKISATQDGKNYENKYIKTTRDFLILRIQISNTGYLPVNNAKFVEISSAGNLCKSTKIFSSKCTSGSEIDSFTVLNEGIDIDLSSRHGMVQIIHMITTENCNSGEKLLFECVLNFNGCSVKDTLCIEIA